MSLLKLEYTEAHQDVISLFYSNMNTRAQNLTRLSVQQLDLTNKEVAASKAVLQLSFKEKTLGRLLPPLFGSEGFREARATLSQIRKELKQVNKDIQNL